MYYNFNTRVEADKRWKCLHVMLSPAGNNWQLQKDVLQHFIEQHYYSDTVRIASDSSYTSLLCWSESKEWNATTNVHIDNWVATFHVLNAFLIYALRLLLNQKTQCAALIMNTPVLWILRPLNVDGCCFWMPLLGPIRQLIQFSGLETSLNFVS